MDSYYSMPKRHKASLAKNIQLWHIYFIRLNDMNRKVVCSVFPETGTGTP